MAWDIVKDDYLELVGVPLATPAWDLEDMDDVVSAAGTVGQNLQVPFRGGVLGQRHWVAAKPMTLRINIYGVRDGEGVLLSVPHPTDGVERNADTLKRHFRPRQNVADGSVLLRRVKPSEIRQARVVITEPLTYELVPPGMARGTVGLTMLEGVWRAPNATVQTLGPFSTETDVTVLNPGTADQFAVQIDLAGTGNEVQLTNLTWDDTEQTWLRFSGAYQNGVFIDTDRWTVFRDVGDPELQPVGGLREHSGHERWLPLAPGDNTVRITPAGGDVTVTFRHFAPYA